MNRIRDGLEAKNVWLLRVYLLSLKLLELKWEIDVTLEWELVFSSALREIEHTNLNTVQQNYILYHFEKRKTFTLNSDRQN